MQAKFLRVTMVKLSFVVYDGRFPSKIILSGIITTCSRNSTHQDLFPRVKAAVILLKLCLATGVLSIPSALSIVGYGPEINILVAWGGRTTCMSSAVQN